MKGKKVPSRQELVDLFRKLIADGMKCWCGKIMVWSGKRGQLNVVSLQHDRSGEIRLLCMECNQRHRAFPGDSFYKAPVGHKFCPQCLRVLPPEMFYRIRRNGQLRSYCRECKKKLNGVAWAKDGKRWSANSRKRKRDANNLL
jgi:hypothetical protein